jgi:hypothetical protein
MIAVHLHHTHLAAASCLLLLHLPQTLQAPQSHPAARSCSCHLPGSPALPWGQLAQAQLTQQLQMVKQKQQQQAVSSGWASCNLPGSPGCL